MTPSLYVHIPICNARCDYCAFYSESGLDRTTKNLLIQSLLNQLHHDVERYRIEGFRTVYIGGGTPTALGAELLLRLIEGIEEYCGSTVEEWTVEANPESMETEILDMLALTPVNRISLGVQSTHPRTRRFLGRRGPLERVQGSLALLNERWPRRLSLDFIRGLPTDESIALRDELSAIDLESVDHLSLYDLSLEQGTPLALRFMGRGENTKGLEADRREDDHTLLEAHGFFPYEVSNFARPGAASLHNQAYWEIDPYLGIGPGAVGFLPASQPSENLWTRFTTIPDVRDYLRSNYPGYMEREQPSRLEFLMEHLIMGLRQVRGVSLERVRSRFGLPLEEIIPSSCSTWLNSGRAVIDDGRLALRGEGFRFQNSLLLEAWQELDRRNSFA